MTWLAGLVTGAGIWMATAVILSPFTCAWLRRHTPPRTQAQTDADDTQALTLASDQPPPGRCALCGWWPTWHPRLGWIPTWQRCPAHQAKERHP